MAVSRAVAAGAVLALTIGAPWSSAKAQKERPFDVVAAELKSPDPRTRLEAVRQLSVAGYLEAVMPLAGVLADPDQRVARAAMYGELGLFLGARVDAEGRVAFIFERPRSNPAMQAFESSWGSLPVMPVPPEVIEGLTRGLAFEDVGERVEALAALAVVAQVDGAATPAHQKAAEAVALRLGDPEPAVRATAARAAGRLFRRCAAPCDGEGAVKLGDGLIRGLGDPEGPVLMAMIEGLGEMRYVRGVEALTRVHERFGKEPPGLAALDALGRIGSAASVPLFKAAVSRKEPAARRAAVEGLARVGDRDGLAAAVSQIEAGPKNAEVALGAAFAQQRIGLGQHLSPLFNAAGGKDTALQVQDYLIELGRSVAPQVAAALPAATGEARARLIEVLGVVGGPDEARAIEAARSNAGNRVEAAAQRTLRRLAAFSR